MKWGVDKLWRGGSGEIGDVGVQGAHGARGGREGCRETGGARLPVTSQPLAQLSLRSPAPPAQLYKGPVSSQDHEASGQDRTGRTGQQSGHETGACMGPVGHPGGVTVTLILCAGKAWVGGDSGTENRDGERDGDSDGSRDRDGEREGDSDGDRDREGGRERQTET